MKHAEFNTEINTPSIKCRRLYTIVFLCAFFVFSNTLLAHKSPVFAGDENNCMPSFELESNTASPINRASSAVMMPTIENNVLPCQVRENPIGSGGNATTLENGQFTDLVEVTSLTGETWTVVTADGFYAATSPQPPFSPTIIASGTLLTETAAGSGVYQLEGVYTEAIGYTLIVTNGVQDLSAEILPNECAYPNPSFVDLRAGYCLSTPSFALTADNDGEIGTGVFRILNANDGTEIEANATEFAPADLGEGTFIVEYTFAQDNGPTQTISQSITISPAPGSLSCNDNIQVSLQENCEAVITIDMMLEGNYDNAAIFDIEIFNGLTPVTNPVTSADEGDELTVNVIDFCSGNYCTGTIIVEDKQAPVFDCPVDVVSVDCTVNLSEIPAPTVTDNCDGIVDAQLVGQEIENFSCDNAGGLIRRVVREYTAIDSRGNQVQENCIQTIEFPQGDLADVLFPSDAVYECGIDDISNLSPNVTGRPTLNGVPILNNSICNFYSFSNDDTLQTCGNSFKIVRSWTIIDWCDNSSTPTNTILAEQIIEVRDSTDPEIVCQPTLTVSTVGQACTANVEIPTADVADNCGTASYQVFANNGLVDGNMLNNLPIGTTFLAYNATDDCGNFAQCETIITVTDAASPVMVCDEITTVTLNTGGTAEVDAVEFDDGSYDGCSGLDFDIRRIDGDGTFYPTVLFDCDDPSAPIEVEVRATDAFDNSNSCVVQVIVEDNTAPNLICNSSNIVVPCTENFEDFFLPPVIDEVCSIFPTELSTESSINSCGVGTATRTYTVTDAAGNSSFCSQTIVIANDNPLTAADIEFPADFDSAICGTTIESLEPDSLPVNFQEPIINAPPCSQVAVSKSDEVFENTGACLTIMRTWTVVDWCAFDVDNPGAGGIFSHVQEITVTDNQAPVLVCPPNPFVKIINPNCDTTIFAFGPDTLMDCSQNVQLSSTLQKMPIDNPEHELMSSNSLGPYEDLLPGNYQVYLTANDGCGNTSSCEYVLLVEDNKPPTPYCHETLVAELMETGMVDFPAVNFDAGSFDNCTPPELLLFSYSENPFDTVRMFTCEDIGFNDLEMYVTDEGFNSAACSVTLIIQDNSGACDNERTVSGLVRTEDAVNIADVNISVNGGLTTEMTNEDGMFELSLAEGGDYTLFPEKDINLTNGITTFDIVLIRQHVLNLSQLDSPYKMIAADINNTGSITTADVVLLKSVILGLADNFPNNTSWRFVDADFQFPNPQNPWESGFPEFINFNNLSSDIEGADFVGVKIGDINGSASGGNFDSGSGDERNADQVLVSAQNTIVKSGSTQTLWIEKSDATSIAGLQSTIAFNTKMLSFVRLETDEGVNLSDFNLTASDTGLLAVSWENAAAEKENLRFGLTFRVNETTDWKSAVSLSDEMLIAEAYRMTNNKMAVADLRFDFVEPSEGQFSLHQNAPNPFSTQTSITFELPQESAAQLTIFDATGREIYRHSAVFGAGLQRINISAADLNNNKGILIYRLEAGSLVAVKRMMLL